MERNASESSISGMPIPFVPILKCLVYSYILTAILLLGLAGILYKFSLSESTVSIAIIAVYVLATFFAGFVAGKQLKSRKFLWGLLLGGLYFLVLVAMSMGANHGMIDFGNSFMTTCVLCLCGGMIGGMLS